MSPKLLLTLGPGLTPAPHAHLLVLDWERREILDTFRYRHVVYPESHKGFAGCSKRGNRILVAMEAEILEIGINPLRFDKSHSFHFLNDVHHVAATKDRVFVCNTGLDCIEEFDPDWHHLSTHNLVHRLGCSPKHLFDLLKYDFRKSWKRIRGHYDYYSHMPDRPMFQNIVKLMRKNAYRTNGRELRFSDFRPHFLHPNHILPVEDDLWITLWHTGSIVSFKTGNTIADNLGRPHDGVIFGNEYYVTDCRANRLIVFRTDANGCKNGIGAKINEATVTQEIHEGFLRGIVVIEDLIFCGLTARRGAPPNLQTARVIALDRKTLQRLGEWTVPTHYGRSLFTIADVSDAY